MYILISNKLEKVYGSVQGGHAVAQWILEHPNQNWNNEYLIYVESNIEFELYRLKHEDISIFREPDLDNQITAIAVKETETNSRHLKKMKLWK